MIIRDAAISDASHLVREFELASDGLAPYLWAQNTAPEGEINQFALNSMKSKLAIAATNTTLIAEIDGVVAGGILTYAVADKPETIGPDMDPIIVPLIDLENAVPLTYYVNALAVFPEFQGRGIRSALLRQVQRNAEPNVVSPMMIDDNTRARHVYKRARYKAAGSTRIVKGDWAGPGENYVLMHCKAA